MALKEGITSDHELFANSRRITPGRKDRGLDLGGTDETLLIDPAPADILSGQPIDSKLMPLPSGQE